MKYSTNLIIFSIFSLHLLCMSDGRYCENMRCSDSGPSIEYPFYIKALKPNSCDTPGFEVYCEGGSGERLLELRPDGNFIIDYIYPYSRIVQLSDPDDCLPQKLMSLDLNNIGPFQLAGDYEYFQLYNCSWSLFLYSNYDNIDCLSSFGHYIVIRIGANSTFSDSNHDCTFLKTLPSFRSGILYDQLSSSISLTWNESSIKCASCNSYAAPPPSEADNGIGVGLGVGLTIPAAVLLGIFFCYKCLQQSSEPSSRITNEVSGLQSQSQSTAVTGGLEQTVIDSYPVVVIGDSGRLIKPDDDTCPICLSDYAPHETLKILPECLHRFHADCIDEWLRTKAICPICRVSPPRR